MDAVARFPRGCGLGGSHGDVIGAVTVRQLDEGAPRARVPVSGLPGPELRWGYQLLQRTSWTDFTEADNTPTAPLLLAMGCLRRLQATHMGPGPPRRQGQLAQLLAGTAGSSEPPWTVPGRTARQGTQTPHHRGQGLPHPLLVQLTWRAKASFLYSLWMPGCNPGPHTLRVPGHWPPSTEATSS